MSTYDIDFRAHPEAYRIQPNEKDVFKVEPYKSALLGHWRLSCKLRKLYGAIKVD